MKEAAQWNGRGGGKGTPQQRGIHRGRGETDEKKKRKKQRRDTHGRKYHAHREEKKNTTYNVHKHIQTQAHKQALTHARQETLTDTLKWKEMNKRENVNDARRYKGK